MAPKAQNFQNLNQIAVRNDVIFTIQCSQVMNWIGYAEFSSQMKISSSYIFMCMCICIIYTQKQEFTKYSQFQMSTETYTKKEDQIIALK